MCWEVNVRIIVTSSMLKKIIANEYRIFKLRIEIFYSKIAKKMAFCVKIMEVHVDFAELCLTWTKRSIFEYF